METVARAPDPTPGPPDPTLAPDLALALPLRMRLRSGWPAFDDLDLLAPGRVVLADIGAEPGQRLLCRLLSDAVAARGEAVVLDGGNWTDVYRLAEEAEAMGHDRLATLLGVRVARGFTAYQLQSLVEDALPRLLAEEGASVGLVLAPMLPEMYLDEDLKPDEARELAARALRVLQRCAVEHDVPVVVSNSTLMPGVRHRMRAVLEENVDAVVGLFPAPNGGLRIVAPGGTRVLAPAPGARQRVLADFAPADRAPAGIFMRTAPDARIRYLSKRAGELKFRQKQQSAAAAGA